MSTFKFASLHGGLLARKGQAAPAVPSPHPQMIYTDNPPPHSNDSPPAARHSTALAGPPQTIRLDPKRLQQELATAFPLSAPPLTPPEEKTPEGTPPEDRVPEDIVSKDIASKDSASKDNARESTAPCACASPMAEPAPVSSKRKYQVRLRINGEQRRRLRTAAAQFGVSNQHILSDALEAYLDQLGVSELKNCACLARLARPQ